MHEKRLAFVLSGGGARGAFQAGALRALFENAIHPDILTGTSIGSLNAAFLAVHGVNSATVEQMIQLWLEAVKTEMLPTNINWLTLRTILKTPDFRCYEKLQSFLVRNGIGPDLRFRDIRGVQLFLVATDLYTGEPVIYGQNPDQSVMEGVLASCALPPYFPPLERNGKLLMDGGTVSNLPVEAAVSAGATEILALDVTDPRVSTRRPTSLIAYLLELVSASEQRHIALEIALARAKGIPVDHILLFGRDRPVAATDFSAVPASIQTGYAITRHWLEQWDSSCKVQPISGILPEMEQGETHWSGEILPARRF